MRFSCSRSYKKDSFLGCGLGALIVGTIVIGSVCYRASAELVSIKVNDKERIVESTGDRTTSRYLVFTEDEVFENTDSFLFGKFNSSDVQGQLQTGKTYLVLVAGKRRPWLSEYRNIIRVEQRAPD